MAVINTDVSNVEPQKSFEPVPAGTYTAQITDSSMNPTRAGNGHYLKLEFTILDGPDGTVGRKVWTNLNLDNPNKQAVEIAYSELSAICHAIGHSGQVADSEELHGQPLEIDVSIREDETGKHQPQNEVRAYRPSVNSAPAASAGNAPPWAKKAS